MLAEHWMEEHGITFLQLSPAEARTRLFAWLKPRWQESAIKYVQKKLVPPPALALAQIGNGTCTS